MSTAVARIPTADVRVSISAPVKKLCPVKDEKDAGWVTIAYRTGGEAIELHGLAELLATFADRRLSHEDFTAELADALNADVSSRWMTAGMEVVCDAVLRESVNPDGA